MGVLLVDLPDRLLVVSVYGAPDIRVRVADDHAALAGVWAALPEAARRSLCELGHDKASLFALLRTAVARPAGPAATCPPRRRRGGRP